MFRRTNSLHNKPSSITFKTATKIVIGMHLIGAAALYGWSTYSSSVYKEFREKKREELFAQAVNKPEWPAANTKERIVTVPPTQPLPNKQIPTNNSYRIDGSFLISAADSIKKWYESQTNSISKFSDNASVFGKNVIAAWKTLTKKTEKPISPDRAPGNKQIASKPVSVPKRSAIKQTVVYNNPIEQKKKNAPSPPTVVKSVTIHKTNNPQEYTYEEVETRIVTKPRELPPILTPRQFNSSTVVRELPRNSPYYNQLGTSL